MRKITLLLSLVFCSSLVLAKTKKPEDAGIPQLKNEEMFLAFSKPVKSMAAAKRKVASDAHLSESDLSSEFKNFRTEFLAVKTADQLDSFLDKAQANYEKYPNDVKVVAANLLMLKPLRGIETRTSSLLGGMSSSARKMKALVGHALRNIDLFYNVDQGVVLREYLTTFPANTPAMASIPSISHLQNYLIDSISPMLIQTAKNISAVEKNLDNSTVFVFDNKMSYGTASFQDGLQRYRTYGKAELNFMLTNIYATLHEISFATAYNLNNAFIVMDLLKYDQIFAKFTNFSFMDVAQERASIITKNKGFLAFREENFSKTMMSKSYVYLTQAIQGANTTWALINDRSFNSTNMINDETVKSTYAKTNLALTNLQSMIEDKGFHPVRSQVTGEVVFVNLYAFFNNPPSNLNIFIPSKFNKDKYGKATTWNLAPLSAYMRSNADGLESMDKVVRVLSQASGGRHISSVYLSL